MDIALTSLVKIDDSNVKFGFLWVYRASGEKSFDSLHILFWDTI
jgi:hypothetical protein